LSNTKLSLLSFGALRNQLNAPLRGSWKHDGANNTRTAALKPLTLQIEVDNPLPSAAAHIPNIGRMIEDME